MAFYNRILNPANDFFQKFKFTCETQKFLTFAFIVPTSNSLTLGVPYDNFSKDNNNLKIIPLVHKAPLFSSW